jgi:cell division protease FtsH
MPFGARFSNTLAERGAMPEQRKTEPRGPEDPKRSRVSAGALRRAAVWFPIAFLWLFGWQLLFEGGTSTLAYSDFKQHLKRGEVVEVALTEAEVHGLIAPGGLPPELKARLAEAGGVETSRTEEPWYTPLLPPRFRSEASEAAHEAQTATASRQQATLAEVRKRTTPFRTVRVEDDALIEELTAADVRFRGTRPSLLSQFLWSWVLPVLFIIGIWSFLARRFSRSTGASLLSLGKSRAKVLVDKTTGVTFGDVAGCDEAKHELVEVVDFLKYPSRYAVLGAAIPKGVLLVGPPGTGKTLLARAVAGEAMVPFFSISGSDFVEMIVGVGAARVRDLFAEAKKQAPCIVFIDEIDAIGRHRSVQAVSVNDEREQTLNQLLSEMDGFEPNTGVIVLAATNRPEILDRALLRPGRFDRQVVIDAPDRTGREAILKVHTRTKPLAADVDLAKVAKATPGLAGADLANAVNEAALLATRRDAREITQKDFMDAIEKVLAGPERRSRRLGDEERQRVAFHEAGHALVAASCKYADPVQKISIVPRGKAALGYTLQLSESETFILTKAALLDRIAGLLGGRAAEEIVFGDVSTGAENDLEKATMIAEQMVCMYGMGRKVGLSHVGERRPLYVVQGPGETLAKNCGPETATMIDEEIRAILNASYAEARRILEMKRDKLARVADELLAKETLEGQELDRLLGVSARPEAVAAAPSMPMPPDERQPALGNASKEPPGLH